MTEIPATGSRSSFFDGGGGSLIPVAGAKARLLYQIFAADASGGLRSLSRFPLTVYLKPFTFPLYVYRR